MSILSRPSRAPIIDLHTRQPMEAKSKSSRGGYHEPLPTFTISFPGYTKNQKKLKQGSQRNWVSFHRNVAHDPKVAGMGMESVAAFMLIVVGSDEGSLVDATVKDLAIICHRKDLRQMRRSLHQIVSAGLADFSSEWTLDEVCGIGEKQSRPKADPKPSQSHPKADPLHIALVGPVIEPVLDTVCMDSMDGYTKGGLAHDSIPPSEPENARPVVEPSASEKLDSDDAKAKSEIDRRRLADATQLTKEREWLHGAMDESLGRKLYDRLAEQGRKGTEPKRYIAGRLQELRLFAKKLPHGVLEMAVLATLEKIDHWSLAYFQTIALGGLGAPSAKSRQVPASIEMPEHMQKRYGHVFGGQNAQG
jgi:hypothetical protein